MKTWISKLEKELGGPSSNVEKGFRPAQEWKTIWNIQISRCRELLREHVASGRMERKDFKIPGGVKPHYRAIK